MARLHGAMRTFPAGKRPRGLSRRGNLRHSGKRINDRRPSAAKSIWSKIGNPMIRILPGGSRDDEAVTAPLRGSHRMRAKFVVHASSRDS